MNGFTSPEEVGLTESDRAGFKFDSVDKLLQTPAPIDWVLKGQLPKGSLVVAYGDPESAKSLIFVNLAIHVALGDPFCGLRVPQGAAFYLNGEGAHGLGRRLKAYSEHHQKDLVGCPLFFSQTAASLSDPESAEDVSLAIQEIAHKHNVEPRVIIIDTLALNSGPIDENSNSDVGRLITNIEEFLISRTGATVILVHHTGHKDKLRARGASALLAAVRLEFRITKDGSIVRMEATKSNDFERPAPLSFEIKGVQLPWVDADDEQVTGPIVLPITYIPKKKSLSLGKNQRIALNKLILLHEDHQFKLRSENQNPDDAMIMLDEWRSACREGGINGKRFPEVLDALKAKGVLQTTGNLVKPRK